MREDTMKSRLVFLTGVVALAFVGPISAHAARIDISDFAVNEADNPSFTQSGFTAFISSRETEVSGKGTLVLTGTYVAVHPLAAEVVEILNFNMNDSIADGEECCSDTLKIIRIGAPGGPGDANMSVTVVFSSGFPEGTQVTPLDNATLMGENVAIFLDQGDLGVTATSDPVPGPIAGAGLPGLILACGGLLLLARRRKKIA
jgi:hypothetical protein